MKTKLNILLIEDDMIEIMKFNRVIEKSLLKIKITEANNGEEALKILKDGNGSLPNIISN